MLEITASLNFDTTGEAAESQRKQQPAFKKTGLLLYFN